MAVFGHRVTEFDTWRPLYGGSSVEIRRAGTTELLPVYSDPLLTLSVANPQVLITTLDNRTNYGKFGQPIYVGEAYYLVINDTDQTGVSPRALNTVVGENVSESVVATRRGQRVREVQDILDQVIFAADYGPIGDDSPTTNTQTANAAIGAAAAQGGGIVKLPAGPIALLTLTLPEGVILEGHGITGTTLQSLEAQAVVTIGGDRAGLRRLTLDGLNLVPGSVGIEAEARDWVVMDEVLVKRFEINGRFKGGRYFNWHNFSAENGVDGILLMGEGAALEQNLWVGGSIRQHTGIGLQLRFVDDWCRHNTLRRILFDENVGDAALDIEGARHTKLEMLQWVDNLVDLDVRDGTDTSEADRNTVVGLTAEDCMVSGGTLKFDDTCELVAFRRSVFTDGVVFQMELPDNFVLLEDCIEAPDTAASHNARQLVRGRTEAFMEVVGVTTDNTTITAWEYLLEPGQLLDVEAKVKGNRRNGAARAMFHVARFFRRPSSQLDYDNQTSNFTVGGILTGQTSGATARITADNDSGATGTLSLRNIIGVFQDNEIITDNSGGSAQANGVVVDQNAATLGAMEEFRENKSPGSNADNYAVDLNVSGGKARLQVTGDTGHVVEWSLRIEVFD